MNQPTEALEASSAGLDDLLRGASDLLRRHEPQRARDVLEQALVLAPGNLHAQNLLARCCLEVGQLADALVLYELIEAELPTSVRAKVNLAFVLIKLGRAATAKPLLERAIELSPDHRRAWGYLGIALEQLGQYEEAERALLAGHYATAARRLRERHADREQKSIREFSPESARTAMPATKYGRQTLPPEAPSPIFDGPSTPTVGVSQLRRFNTTLRPPELIAGQPARVTIAPPSAVEVTTPPPESLEEIPPDMTATRMATVAPASGMQGDERSPKPTQPILPLLDAALASLLLAPSEASVGVHATGLVVVSLAESATREGGFAARLDCVQAAVGSLVHAPLSRDDARRDPLAAQPFSSGRAPVSRFTGAGQLVLQPQRGKRLLPLAMDADVAFLREELVVGFDHALLYDLGRVRLAGDEMLSLVRFRGDGVVVLELAQSFLAFDVRGDQRVTLRSDTLVGWVGLLFPEPAEAWFQGAPATDFVTFSGEGTVLFIGPPET